jgi:hypothetical protein
MITPNQIVDEINRLLVVAYPEPTVYINRCPKKFDRPSFLIETVKAGDNPASRKMVKCEAYFTVTCFVKVDEFGNGADGVLTAIQTEVMGIFRKGYIKVGDRAIKVKASSGGSDFDRSYVDLQFEYFDNRSDDVDNTPLIGDVDLIMKKEE